MYRTSEEEKENSYSIRHCVSMTLFNIYSKTQHGHTHTCLLALSFCSKTTELERKATFLYFVRQRMKKLKAEIHRIRTRKTKNEYESRKTGTKFLSFKTKEENAVIERETKKMEQKTHIQSNA